MSHTATIADCSVGQPGCRCQAEHHQAILAQRGVHTSHREPPLRYPATDMKLHLTLQMPDGTTSKVDIDLNDPAHREYLAAALEKAGDTATAATIRAATPATDDHPPQTVPRFR